jgi:hypothetical protein
MLDHIRFGMQPIWLFFDDAQDTYWDTGLWNGLFKEVISLGASTKVRIVCFALYGSSSSWKNPDPCGTPEKISADACLGLFPTESSDHALLFTRPEFDSLMALRHEQVKRGISFEHGWVILEDSLQQFFFTASNGHIGAITGLLGMVNDALVSCLFLLIPKVP